MGALFVVRAAQGRHAEAATLCEETLGLLPVHPGTWPHGRFGYLRGWAAYRDGQRGEAVALLRESAAVLGAIGDRRSLADCLDVLGCCAGEDGDAARTVRLVAAADRMRARSGVARHAYLATDVERIATRARATLGARVAHRIAAETPAVADLVAGGPDGLLTTGRARSRAWWPTG
jgi:hypothetical protein